MSKLLISTEYIAKTLGLNRNQVVLFCKAAGIKPISKTKQGFPRYSADVLDRLRQVLPTKKGAK